MGPTWGPSAADRAHYRAQVGPMLTPWALLSGVIHMLPENYLGVICDYITPLSIKWNYTKWMMRTQVKSLHIWMVTMEYNISCLGCCSHHSGTNQFLSKFCINSWKHLDTSRLTIIIYFRVPARNLMLQSRLWWGVWHWANIWDRWELGHRPCYQDRTCHLGG